MIDTLPNAARTDWFMRARWGVFTHYLADSASSRSAPDLDVATWNARVERFDVDRLAEQLQSVGAGYYCITLGQNSGFYCSPNPTYDRLVGITPSKCSRRDLIADLTAALAPCNIPLLVYVTSSAPANEARAVRALRCTPPWNPKPLGYAPDVYPPEDGARTDERLSEFQRNWEAVLRDWSVRWGRRVSGWWVDGVYQADRMYRHPDEPNFGSFRAALIAGNPDALVAFNSGALVAGQARRKHLLEGTMPESGADYTAGELDMVLPVAGRWYDGAPAWPGRFVAGEQLHFLTYLGDWWGLGEPRFPSALVAGYTQHVNDHAGVMSWDVPAGPDGVIPPAFVDQLLTLKHGAG